MPQDALTADKLSLQVLEACSAAYAVRRQGRSEVLWCNRRFAQIASANGLTPAQVAALPAVEGYQRSTAQLDDQAILIELQPVGAASTAGRRDVDPLTGVLTRGAMLSHLSERFSQGDDPPFALVFLDLVDFKAINDQHGHLVGDRCLSEVGARLGHAVRAGDLVGRYGGDEFLILLDGVSDQETYQAIEKRIHDTLDAPYDSAGAELRFSASLGVAYSWAKHPSIEAMIQVADLAMYANKRAAASS